MEENITHLLSAETNAEVSGKPNELSPYAWNSGCCTDILERAVSDWRIRCLGSICIGSSGGDGLEVKKVRPLMHGFCSHEMCSSVGNEVVFDCSVLEKSNWSFLVEESVMKPVTVGRTIAQRLTSTILGYGQIKASCVLIRGVAVLMDLMWFEGPTIGDSDAAGTVPGIREQILGESNDLLFAEIEQKQKSRSSGPGA